MKTRREERADAIRWLRKNLKRGTIIEFDAMPKAIASAAWCAAGCIGRVITDQFWCGGQFATIGKAHEERVWIERAPLGGIVCNR